MPDPTLEHQVWIAGPEGSGKSTLAWCIRQEALARGWDAAGLLGRGQPRTPQQGLTAPRLLIREFQSPEALTAALIAAPPCANDVPVLLCADDLPCRQSGGTTLQDWRQAMSPARPQQEARSIQLVVVYGQDHWRTASAIRSLHFAWPALWPLAPDEAQALTGRRWRATCLDCDDHPVAASAP